MLNNNEWGAVAYLSRSKYGANREVYVNNSSGYYTGRSGGSYNAGTGAGIFNSNSYSGTNNVLYGFRVALAQIGT